MSQTEDAYAQLEARWKTAFASNGLCTAAGKLTEAQAKNIIGELGRSYEPYATRKSDDSTRVSEFQIDLARAEQVMKENGCSAGDQTGIAYGQGATTTLLKHDIEKATTSLEIAALVNNWAKANGWKEPDGGFLDSLGDTAPGGIWRQIPFGVKLAAGALVGVVGLRALARVLGR